MVERETSLLIAPGDHEDFHSKSDGYYRSTAGENLWRKSYLTGSDNIKICACDLFF
jgi:hypothetical protein